MTSLGSVYSGSSTGINFFQSAAIPCNANQSAELAGECAPNIDGVCIKGGNLVPSPAVAASINAFDAPMTLPSLGAPGVCQAPVKLFSTFNERYTPAGMAVFPNNIMAKLTRPLL